MRSVGVWLTAGLVVVGPSAVTAYLAFRSGGYFAGASAIAAVVLGVALVLRLMLADAPFEGFGPPLVMAAVGLGCFTAWTLVSAFWSDAPAQALIAFDRALMLWLALLLFGSLPFDRDRLLWAVRILAATMVVVAIVGLVTRVLPEVLSVPDGFEKNRLGYPLSYWNALGVFVSVALLLCAGLATRREEPLVSRALASAAVPLLVATLYFTFSRGSIGAVLIGFVVFILISVRREMISTALAIVPPTVVVVVLCLGTHALSTPHYASATGVSEGHRLVWELIGCAVAAGLLRVLLLPLDSLLARIEISGEQRRRAWIAFAVVATVVVVVGGIAGSGKISNAFDKFTVTTGVSETGELQKRLTDFNNNGRIAQWKLALDTFADHPVEGTGAGTFGRVWAEKSDNALRIVDSHSLYLGVLAELGAPGLIFLLLALGAILVTTARRIFGPDRVIYAAIFAAMFTWALHAAADWDWQMPATGFFVFSLGAMAIAARPGEAAGWLPGISGRFGRVALSICCLALLVSPVLVAVSQGKLDSAVRKFEAGNCAGASRDALSAIHTLSVRPGPYQVLGFCDSFTGQHRLAVAVLETAVARDEGEWESWYGLAYVRAAAGLDPRAAARKAYKLAPHEPLTIEGIRLFGKGDPQIWKRRAEGARLPIN